MEGGGAADGEAGVRELVPVVMEEGREYPCPVPGCEKRYASESVPRMRTHLSHFHKKLGLTAQALKVLVRPKSMAKELVLDWPDMGKGKIACPRGCEVSYGSRKGIGAHLRDVHGIEDFRLQRVAATGVEAAAAGRGRSIGKGKGRAGEVQGRANRAGREAEVVADVKREVEDRHGVLPSVRAAFAEGSVMAVEGTKRRPEVVINGEKVKNADSFEYLGSWVGGSMEEEVSARVKKAGGAFGQLRGHVWKRKDLTPRVKMHVFQAVVVSTLLYGSEAWAMSSVGLRRMKAFYNNGLRVLARMPRHAAFHASNEAVRKRLSSKEVKCPDVEGLLQQKRLRWYGHVRRMPEERWPRRMLGAVLPGKAQVGGRRVTWEGVVQKDLERVGVVDPWTQSQDKAGWRRLIGRTLSRV